MKNLLFLLYIAPAVTFAQTQSDYQKVMDKFVRYYNNDQTDSVCTLFPSQDKNCFWRHVEPERVKSEYGKIISYCYLGIDKQDPEKVHVFKVVWEKQTSPKTMSFTLSKDMKFGTFRRVTESDGIRELLKAGCDQHPNTQKR